MKNILLLTDFSECSINAMHYALQLLKGNVCNFYVLHVQRSSSYASDDLILSRDSIYDAIIKKSKLKLMKLVNKFKNEIEDENYIYKIVVDFDSLTDAIKQMKASKEIDLIVMGTNGVTGAKEVIFGSNTINVIRKIDCSTLVIPEEFEYRIPKEVLLPLDLNDSLSSSAFAHVLEFVNRFSNALHFLRINPSNEDSEEERIDNEQLNYSLKEINHKYHSIKSVPMHYAVSTYVQTNAIDILILLVQKETLFERFFTGSSTTQISNKIDVPLLIFHS
ncbi:universal stress protein [Hyunsoonleella flava]|uniref:Universal stress protein n=1 Tax=Hyunsoonleella flava TaxID=2527939 RepID=A0A4Q9FFE1_9FLAO|nr:universal stress protein [Hyunsoonleella flava]TBN04351.1 universal stress protein [Hyunsoonleella flava]